MDPKLEIYKMAVEMADRVSSRRMVANGFFLSINTAIAAILTFVYEKSLVNNQRTVAIVVILVGLLVAATWFFSIRSYRRLNTAKFAVINELEKDLPYQYFTQEWANLSSSTDDLEPKQLRKRWLKFKDRYTTLTNIESFVPISFGLIYAVVLAGVVWEVKF